MRPHLQLLAPAVFSVVRDTVIPVKLAAEQAFLALFQVVNGGDTLFEVCTVISVSSPKKSCLCYLVGSEELGQIYGIYWYRVCVYQYLITCSWAVLSSPSAFPHPPVPVLPLPLYTYLPFPRLVLYLAFFPSSVLFLCLRVLTLHQKICTLHCLA